MACPRFPTVGFLQQRVPKLEARLSPTVVLPRVGDCRSGQGKLSEPAVGGDLFRSHDDYAGADEGARNAVRRDSDVCGDSEYASFAGSGLGRRLQKATGDCAVRRRVIIASFSRIWIISSGCMGTEKCPKIHTP
jgi:hypothetical protein